LLASQFICVTILKKREENMRIVMLGPPGVGKGTQAVLLAKAKNIPHISTGDIMRQIVASQSELGNRVKSILDKGELVPDDVMIEVVRGRLQQPDCANGFVLDGFPRTLPQAEALDVLLKKLSMELTHVVDLAVPESVLLERISKRGASGSGRSDDNIEVAKRRLEVYWQLTAPVSEYYTKAGRVIKIESLGTVEEVNEEVLQAIG
jgi:adenylate kinase